MVHRCPGCGDERLNAPSCPSCSWSKPCPECGAIKTVKAIGHGWSCGACGTRYGRD